MAELNETTEVVEEVAETVAEVSRALSPREIRFLLGGIGFGLLGGAVVTTLVTRRRLETKYTKIAEDEIDEMRKHYDARARVVEQKPELNTLVTNLGYSEPNAPKVEEIVEKPDVEVKEAPVEKRDPRDVLEEAQNSSEVVRDTSWDADDGWDYPTQIAQRSPDKPYIIHADELQEEDYTDTFLKYYAEDDVLCNADGSVIDDKDDIVGEINLEKFGLGSGDVNILYIRNDKLGMHMEVFREDGSYSEQVHGYVQHSDTPFRRRRRKYDDEQ